MALLSATTFRVLLLVSLACAIIAAEAKHRGGVIHLRLYMHDITGGPGQTAVQVIKGPGTAHPVMPGSHFGDTTVIDDPLTEAPNTSSQLVGRAQGTYTLASLREPVLMVSMTVADYVNAVVGRDDLSAAVRELAVVGGTGVFRRATGHVLWRTVRMESRDHMVLQLDAYATVPGASPTSAPRDDASEDSLLGPTGRVEV
jgi:hypothetical protein